MSHMFYLNCQSNAEKESFKKGISLFLSIDRYVDTPAVLHMCTARMLHTCVCLERIETAGCATQTEETF